MTGGSGGGEGNGAVKTGGGTGTEGGRTARMQIFAATEIETIRQLESSTRTGLCRFAPPARWRTGLAAAAAARERA